MADMNAISQLPPEADKDPDVIQLRQLYSQAVSTGMMKDNADMQQLGHLMRGAGIVNDPTQGGMVTPPAPPPSPYAKYNLPDKTPIYDIDAQKNAYYSAHPNLYDQQAYDRGEQQFVNDDKPKMIMRAGGFGFYRPSSDESTWKFYLPSGQQVSRQDWNKAYPAAPPMPATQYYDAQGNPISAQQQQQNAQKFHAVHDNPLNREFWQDLSDYSGSVFNQEKKTVSNAINNPVVKGTLNAVAGPSQGALSAIEDWLSHHGVNVPDALRKFTGNPIGITAGSAVNAFNGIEPFALSALPLAGDAASTLYNSGAAMVDTATGNRPGEISHENAGVQSSNQLTNGIYNLAGGDSGAIAKITRAAYYAAHPSDMFSGKSGTDQALATMQNVINKAGDQMLEDPAMFVMNALPVFHGAMATFKGVSELGYTGAARLWRERQLQAVNDGDLDAATNAGIRAMNYEATAAQMRDERQLATAKSQDNKLSRTSVGKTFDKVNNTPSNILDSLAAKAASAKSAAVDAFSHAISEPQTQSPEPSEPAQPQTAAPTAGTSQQQAPAVTPPAKTPEDQAAWDEYNRWEAEQSSRRASVATAQDTPSASQGGERRVDTEARANIDALPNDERDSQIADLRRQLQESEDKRLTSPAGIPNRSAYAEAPSRLPTQVAIDLDGLKSVNDKYGHAAGDNLISSFASALSNAAPKAYHFGGDEFTAEFNNPEHAQLAMKKLSNDFGGQEIDDGQGNKFTGASFGYHVAPTLSEADKGLIDQKSSRPTDATGRVASGIRPVGDAPAVAGNITGGVNDAANQQSTEPNQASTGVKPVTDQPITQAGGISQAVPGTESVKSAQSAGGTSADASRTQIAEPGTPVSAAGTKRVKPGGTADVAVAAGRKDKSFGDAKRIYKRDGYTVPGPAKLQRELNVSYGRATKLRAAVQDYHDNRVTLDTVKPHEVNAVLDALDGKPVEDKSVDVHDATKRLVKEIADKHGDNVQGTIDSLSEHKGEPEHSDKAGKSAPKTVEQAHDDLVKSMTPDNVDRYIDSLFGDSEPAAEDAPVNKDTHDLSHLVDDVYDKLDNATRRDASRAARMLDDLDKQGIDVEDARDYLEEYRQIDKSDYGSTDEYNEARKDAWDEFLDNVSRIDASEVEKAPVKRVGEALKRFYQDEGGEASPVEMGRELVNLLSPTTFVPRAGMDAIHTGIGRIQEKMTAVDRRMHVFEGTMNRMPKADLVDFVDRMKKGLPQRTPELQRVAKIMRELDDNLWREMKKWHPSLPYLADHYRVMWDRIPGSKPGSRQSMSGARAMQGSRGMLKNHTLDTMSDGINQGGIPVSYNPITMFKMSYRDGMKYVAAQEIWSDLKKAGMVSDEPKDGYTRLDDSIAAKYYPVHTATIETAKGKKISMPADNGGNHRGNSVMPGDQIPKNAVRGDDKFLGVVNGGHQYVQQDVARVLKNHLSPDRIRNSSIGRSLVQLKNMTTAMKLSFSLFHALYVTHEAGASQVGLGLRKAANTGKFGQGALDVGRALDAGRGVATLGGSVMKYFDDPAAFANTQRGASFVKAYPDAAQLIHDMFSAGAKLARHDDYQSSAFGAFQRYMADGDKVGAIGKALPALSEKAMSPLFEQYIPRLKVGQFLREYSQALVEQNDRINKGLTTREEVARRTWSSVEDRFGEMNFDNLFWDRTFKTGLQLAFRSVTWKLGNLRAASRAIAGQPAEIVNAMREGRKPLLTSEAAWLIGVSLTTAMMGSIVQKATTGKWAQSLRDAAFPNVNPNDPNDRLAIPSMFKDYVHLLHDPVGYVKSALADDISSALDIFHNADFKNRRIYDDDDSLATKAKKIVLHAAPWPMSITSGIQSHEQGDPLLTSIAKGSGALSAAPTYVNDDPFTTFLKQKAFASMPNEPMSEAQGQHADYKRDLISRENNGQDIMNEIRVDARKPASDSQHLSEREISGIISGKGKDSNARMFGHLTLPDAVKALELATPQQVNSLKTQTRMKIMNNPDQLTPDLKKRLIKLGVLSM